MSQGSGPHIGQGGDVHHPVTHSLFRQRSFLDLQKVDLLILSQILPQSNPNCRVHTGNNKVIQLVSCHETIQCHHIG